MPVPKDHCIGPFTNFVVEPGETAEVDVLVTDNIFVGSVVSIPLVSVKIPETVSGEAKLTPPLVLAMVRFANVVEEAPPMVCAVLPLKVTVLPFGVKEPALDQLPPTNKLPDVALSVNPPDEIVIWPAKPRSAFGMATTFEFCKVTFCGTPLPAVIELPVHSVPTL